MPDPAARPCRWLLPRRDQAGQRHQRNAMSMVRLADAYQRRRRWAGLTVAVLYKFGDDQGTYLAAQITY
jgi:hypothetical protein